MQAKTIAR